MVHHADITMRILTSWGTAMRKTQMISQTALQDRNYGEGERKIAICS